MQLLPIPSLQPLDSNVPPGMQSLRLASGILWFLTSRFWVRPVYGELLHAASRFKCPLQQNARGQPPTWSRLLLTQERNLKEMPICILSMLPLQSGLGLNAQLTSLLFGFRLIGHP